MLTEKEFRTKFKHKFREAIKKNQITKYRVSKDLRIGYMQVKTWYTGETTPSAYYLYLISQYFKEDFLSYEEIQN